MFCLILFTLIQNSEGLESFLKCLWVKGRTHERLYVKGQLDAIISVGMRDRFLEMLLKHKQQSKATAEM